MKIVDANFILRYLLNDNAKQANDAYSILSNNTVLLLNEVVAEIVYVLEKVYKIERSKICSELKDLIANVNVQVDSTEVLMESLNKFESSKLDFIDTILYAYSKVKNAEIYTFDKKLINAIKAK